MKLFIAISTFVFSMTASNSAFSMCTEAAVPVLPDPDTAVMSDILRAQDAVKQYLARQEKFLSCVSDSSRHNAAVDKMHEVADQYNNMARRYKSRMESMDMIVDLALLI
jgi:hypothetical protein